MPAEAGSEADVPVDTASHSDYFGPSGHPSPRQRRPLLVAVVFVLSAVAFWQCRGSSEQPGPADDPGHSESEHP